MKKILILEANPQSDLKLNDEIQELQNVIRRSSDRQEFEIDICGSTVIAVVATISSIYSGQRKSIIAMNIECESLKKMVDFIYAIAKAFEHLNSVVKTFDEATGESLQKIVGNLVKFLTTTLYLVITTGITVEP